MADAPDEKPSQPWLSRAWWLGLPLVVAALGYACSFLSRVEEGAGHAGVGMVVVGGLLGYAIGLALYLWAPRPDTRMITGALLISAVLMVVAVVARILVGEALGFAFVHLLLTFGMAYQVVSWVVLARLLREWGVPGWAALLTGLVLDFAGPVAVELTVVVLYGSGLDGGAIFQVGLGLALVAVLLVGTWCVGPILAAVSGPKPAEEASPKDAQDDAQLARLERVARAYDLTMREKEVLALLDSDRSLPQIAEELCVSPGTVKTHASHLYHKLGVEGREGAVALLRAQG
jgi:DNA-binding CsgD family transcriptional regulator